jgi:hypothetical protein
MQFGRPLPFSASVGATKTAVKTGPCRVYGWQILNTTAAIAYVQVFNKALADVAVGTTTPDYVIPLPASGGAVFGPSDIGIDHDTAMSIACTTTRTGSSGATCDVLIDAK